MFSDIENLLGAIDQFKSSVTNSNELLKVLRDTSDRLEQTEIGRKLDSEQLQIMRSDLNNLVESLNTISVRLEHHIALSKEDRDAIVRRISLGLVGVAALAVLLLFVK